MRYTSGRGTFRSRPTTPSVKLVTTPPKSPTPSIDNGKRLLFLDGRLGVGLRPLLKSPGCRPQHQSKLETVCSACRTSTKQRRAPWVKTTSAQVRDRNFPAAIARRKALLASNRKYRGNSNNNRPPQQGHYMLRAATAPYQAPRSYKQG